MLRSNKSALVGYLLRLGLLAASGDSGRCTSMFIQPFAGPAT